MTDPPPAGASIVHGSAAADVDLKSMMTDPQASRLEGASPIAIRVRKAIRLLEIVMAQPSRSRKRIDRRRVRALRAGLVAER